MSKIAPKRVIKAWLSDKPSALAAKELGISPAAFYARAKYLRDIGVNLPKRKVKKQQPADVDALNRYIEENKR